MPHVQQVYTRVELLISMLFVVLRVPDLIIGLGWVQYLCFELLFGIFRFAIRVVEFASIQLMGSTHAGYILQPDEVQEKRLRGTPRLQLHM